MITYKKQDGKVIKTTTHEEEISDVSKKIAELENRKADYQREITRVESHIAEIDAEITELNKKK